MRGRWIYPSNLGQFLCPRETFLSVCSGPCKLSDSSLQSFSENQIAYNICWIYHTYWIKCLCVHLNLLSNHNNCSSLCLFLLQVSCISISPRIFLLRQLLQLLDHHQLLQLPHCHRPMHRIH